MGMERKERKIMVGVDESEESMFGLFLVYHQPYCRHPQRYTSPSMLHACFAFFPLPNIFVNHIYLRLLFFPRLTNSMSCVTGYSSHAILAMEQHGKDLANSVMERAEAICKDFKTTNVL